MDRQNDRRKNKLILVGLGNPPGSSRLTGWIHNTQFTDNKLKDDLINEATVDIGQNINWSICDCKEDQNTTIDGKEYVEKNHKNTTVIARIPRHFKYCTYRKNGSEYSLNDLSEQQQAIVLASIDKIVKFLNNNTKYKPLQATIMGFGKTGTSFIIITTISIVQKCHS
jgi:hypothetical protein